jgi:hypothetical protein
MKQFQQIDESPGNPSGAGERTAAMPALVFANEHNNAILGHQSCHGCRVDRWHLPTPAAAKSGVT